ncbi:MAG: endonuclease/exonuclease/phosphatase family protein [Streptococcaceae bacterium]|jgi:maltose 6'-phosphate phosphatase|nr:endonuclease/exonuclease/phosphatase family protein [Streptococcaceae bacterium]
MKCLTLNTHSWIEKDSAIKLAQLTQQIIAADYDIIALQEINQSVAAPKLAETSAYFCPTAQQTPIKADNFAYCLIEALKARGVNYYWAWDMSHIGYDIYEEGASLLSKQKISAESRYVSSSHAPDDYHSRRMVYGITQINHSPIFIMSCHFSWWLNENTGFAYEWQNTLDILKAVDYPKLLLGDFNNPDDSMDYQWLTQNSSDLVDSYLIAKKKIGAATVLKNIDGWENNTEALRIDYIFVSKTIPVDQYRVVFTGENEPIISDHFGVEIEG